MKRSNSLVSVNEARWRTLTETRNKVLDLATNLEGVVLGRIDISVFRGNLVSCPKPEIKIIERFKI